jgi:hypothetical protein
MDDESLWIARAESIQDRLIRERRQIDPVVPRDPLNFDNDR